MFMVHKYYKYAPKATAVSALSSMAAVLFLIFAFYFGSVKVPDNKIYLLWTILCLGAAVFMFFYMSRVFPEKIAGPEGEKNIKTKPSYALLYCRENPEAYDTLVKENPAFAEKYERTEDGKIKKRKK